MLFWLTTNEMNENFLSHSKQDLVLDIETMELFWEKKEFQKQGYHYYQYYFHLSFVFPTLRVEYWFSLKAGFTTSFRRD